MNLRFIVAGGAALTACTSSQSTAPTGQSHEISLPGGTFKSGAYCGRDLPSPELNTKPFDPHCEASLHEPQTTTVSSFSIERKLRTVGSQSAPTTSASYLQGLDVKTFEDALTACRASGGTLPTTDQFQYAAGGIFGFKTPWAPYGSPCAEGEAPSLACLTTPALTGLEGAANNPQWVVDTKSGQGLIAGSLEYIYTIRQPSPGETANYRCARPTSAGKP